MRLRPSAAGRLGGAAALLSFALATAPAGCRSDSRDYFVVPFDAGAQTDGGRGDAEAELDPTLGGPCAEDAQCDDLIACTFDRCDETLGRCRNTPDDAQCEDGEYCNGKEKCEPRRGCVAGPVVSCRDGDGCTIDRCVEATKTCEHAPRDSDGDGDPDDHCEAKRDCDDTDPTVSSRYVEICNNAKDDDCDGEIDESPCSTPANDVCATALQVTAPGTYLLETFAAQKDYATSCSVTNPAAARDIVLAITVPAGDARDVVVRAETSAPANDVAVAIRRTCGALATETSCGHTASTMDARAIARAVPPGSTVYAVVTTQTESSVDVRVDMPAATAKPTNESCASPQAVPVDQPFSISLIDAAKDVPSACDERAKTGELSYSFSIDAPRDVRIFASTLFGHGDPVVSLRASGACAEELRCRVGNTPPVYARNLAAGTYTFSVAGTAQIDASVVVKTYPPTESPLNQSCATAPEAPSNVPFSVNLAGQEDAIQNGCLPGGVNAAYKLSLLEPSDVLLVGRVPSNELGAVSLNSPACGTSDVLVCSAGSAPLRVSKRNLAPGDYRVVIADQKALNTELMVLVRPTVPPVTVTSDTCVSPTIIPETGGFFVGDTTNASASFSAGCDAPGQAIGGAKDQLLRLDLTQQRRVVFDMMGSTMTTLLDVRSGAPCPGVEVPNACAIGTSSSRSFLDLVLDAGTYWVQVDGYGGASGPWNLDVRVLPP